MKKVITLSILCFVFLMTKASDTTSFSLNIGASKYAAIRIQDKVTSQILTASVSSVQVANSNPAIADISLSTISSAPTIKAAGISAGTGTATVTCDVSYTDPGDGLQKNESKTIVVAYTVVGTPHGVSLSLVFN